LLVGCCTYVYFADEGRDASGGNITDS